MTISSSILNYCTQRIGRKEGDGECWTLAENAVVSSGGQSSRGQTPNFGRSSNYVWGNVVQINALSGGNILQFRNYTWTRTIKVRVTFADGGWTESTNTSSQTRPHHTAIVSVVGSSGNVEVIEQNVPEGGNVTRNDLCLVTNDANAVTTQERRRDSGGQMQDVTVVTTTSDQVGGTIWAYAAKAVARESQ